MAVQEHRLSRRANDGSRNDMQDNGYDEHPHESRDQRAGTRTTFLERDVDRYCTDEFYAQKLKRALRYQEGEQVNANGMRSREQQNREEDKRRFVGSLASQLELTDRQRDRVEHLVFETMSIDSFGHYSMEKAVLATINVVAREDDRWIEDEEQFQEYLVLVGLDDDGVPDLTTLRRLREMVRERIPSR